MQNWRSASQFARAPIAEFAKSFIGELIQPARSSVLVDLTVEVSGLELLEPGTKFSELLGRKLLYGLFDFFQLGHAPTLPQA